MKKRRKYMIMMEMFSLNGEKIDSESLAKRFDAKTFDTNTNNVRRDCVFLNRIGYLSRDIEVIKASKLSPPRFKYYWYIPRDRIERLKREVIRREEYRENHKERDYSHLRNRVWVRVVRELLIEGNGLITGELIKRTGITLSSLHKTGSRLSTNGIITKRPDERKTKVGRRQNLWNIPENRKGHFNSVLREIFWEGQHVKI